MINYSLSAFEFVTGSTAYTAFSGPVSRVACTSSTCSSSRRLRHEPQIPLRVQITSNPPYQEMDSDNGRGASSVFPGFVYSAKALSPNYISMIMPARWYAGGKNLDDFRDEMLKDKHISALFDYEASKEIFPTADIAGGLCYFLWEKDKETPDCLVSNIAGTSRHKALRPLDEYPVFIRWNKAISILKKVLAQTSEFSDDMVLSQKPFGFRTYERGSETATSTSVKLIHSDGFGYVERADVTKNENLIDWYKIIVGRFVPSNGEIDVKPGQGFRVTTTPRILNAGEICTETYIVVNAFKSLQEAENFVSYYKTKFMRFLLKLSVSSVNISKDVFAFVPKQDYSVSWSDEKLYSKYHLEDEEIEFIEFMMKSMVEPSATVNPIAGVVEVVDDDVIRYYGENGNNLDLTTVGSWAVYFNDMKTAVALCKDAIASGVVDACTRDNADTGFIYFYIDGTSDADQRAFAEWLFTKESVIRDDNGKIKDFCYTYDIRTSEAVKADAHFSDFIDLETGKVVLK